MSYKTIIWFIHAFEELAAALEQKNTKLTAKWLKEIKEENDEQLDFGKEHHINFLLDLHGAIKTSLGMIQTDKNKAAIVETLDRLKRVTDQTKVRDKIIAEIISPIIKSWGWKKKGRGFLNVERGYVKKLRIFSSQWNDYYHVEFTFEMDVAGKGVNIYGERIRFDTRLGKRDRWYVLTPDTDGQKVKAQIQADLKVAKEFFEKYR